MAQNKPVPYTLPYTFRQDKVRVVWSLLTTIVLLIVLIWIGVSTRHRYGVSMIICLVLIGALFIFVAYYNINRTVILEEECLVYSTMFTHRKQVFYKDIKKTCLGATGNYGVTTRVIMLSVSNQRVSIMDEIFEEADWAIFLHVLKVKLPNFELDFGDRMLLKKYMPIRQ